MQKKDENDLRPRSGRLTLLELMVALAMLGILLTWVLKQFFVT